jgi:hypothetical protein
MKVLEMEITPAQIPPIQVQAQGGWPRFCALAIGRLRCFWHFALAGAKRKHKLLVVRETAGLGDRRFVSVIQFERLRFLVASGPSSISLLAQLPDDPTDGQQPGNRAGEGN